jgi:putative holliday junction resolvase
MPSAPAGQPLGVRAVPFPAFPDVMADEVVLGFDFGERRTGIAIANTVTRQARPLTTIETPTAVARWSAVQTLVDEWHPARFVVGIPRHPDGTPHEMTARCERFARQLEGRFGRPVARVDERYSSAVAGRVADVDAEAAAVILQQWLNGGADA